MFSIDEIKKRIEPICKRYGVKKVFLYGSYARGEASDSSNINMRIEKGSLEGIDFFRFADELEDILGKPTDVITTESLSYEFLNMIKPDEVVIYED